MAKTKKDGKEVENEGVVTEAQARAHAHWAEHNSPEAKREAAAERQKLVRERSPREQLDRLDQRLGVGVGAEKERARLTALIVPRS